MNEWQFIEKSPENQFVRMSMIAARLLRLVSHQQIERGRAQLRAFGIKTKEIPLPKKPTLPLAERFPHLTIKEEGDF